MKKTNKYFKYIVVFAVMLIPFMYSFFYLKAYWNPYGEGNIDNIPVAMVNLDKGDKGKEFVDAIKKSKKLKISEVSKKDAEEGLYDTDYYAVITIPSDFTANMESAKGNDKKHATITYSPNQKANYLASQIINTVVNTASKNLDNNVNSKIVGSLSDKLDSVPESLETVSDGFSKLEDGTKKLSDGSSKINNGLSSLNGNYNTFNNGIKEVNNGANKLKDATSSLEKLSASINPLVKGVSDLKTGSDKFSSALTSYTTAVSSIMAFEKNAAFACQRIISGSTAISDQQLCGAVAILQMPVNNIIAAYNANSSHSGIDDNTYYLAVQLKNLGLGSFDLVTSLQKLGTIITSSNKELNTGISTLNTSVSKLNGVDSKINELSTGIKALANGTNKLYANSQKINNGIGTLSNGSNTLHKGINTLNTSVSDAKNKMNNKINDTKTSLTALNDLEEYSKEPVVVDTKVVNEVPSYGTAFAPLFISIALWVGCLMMFVVFYYDKEKRFKKLGMDNRNYVERNLCYHAAITMSAIILGIALECLLDMKITNVALYYISIILIANTFMAIMQLLIVNFNDVGKFVALIILVLQLAASGGTFPIETVTKGFRWMNGILPMTYTIKLLKESVVTIESKLLTSNLIIVICIFVVFFITALVLDIMRLKKEK